MQIIFNSGEAKLLGVKELTVPVGTTKNGDGIATKSVSGIQVGSADGKQYRISLWCKPASGDTPGSGIL